MIWILDSTPEAIAQALDDRSLSRIIKDIAQVLCNVSHILHWEYLEENKCCKEPRPDCGCYYDTLNNEETPLQPNSYLDKNYLIRWAVWARTCLANYHYLCDLAQECIVEFYFRKNLDFNRIVGSLNLSRTTGIDYAVWCIGGSILAGLKLHKYHESIEWCVQNPPELPTQAAGREIGETTAFPISAIPAWFLNKDRWIKNENEFIAVTFYREFYQYKLNKGLRRKVRCEGCAGDGIIADFTGEDPCCCYYCKGSGEIADPIIPKFTRREKPAWLTPEEVK